MMAAHSILKNPLNALWLLCIPVYSITVALMIDKHTNSGSSTTGEFPSHNCPVIIKERTSLPDGTIGTKAGENGHTPTIFIFRTGNNRMGNCIFRCQDGLKDNAGIHRIKKVSLSWITSSSNFLGNRIIRMHCGGYAIKIKRKTKSEIYKIEKIFIKEVPFMFSIYFKI